MHLFKRGTVSVRDDYISNDVRYQILSSKKFANEMRLLVNIENPELVLNCDGTNWKLYLNGILTWMDTGSQNVAISITNNEKNGLTVMETVNLTG
jgi:hypothetical protein